MNRRRNNVRDRYPHTKTQCIQTDVPDENEERRELHKARAQLNDWITKMERGLYVDPEACASASQVYTIIRQLKVVITRVRAKIEILNKYIKHLNHMKRDIGISIDQLDRALVFHKELATIWRPNFVKNQFEEQNMKLNERTGKVVLCKNRQLEALRILKVQFLKVQQQRLDLSELRKTVQEEVDRLADFKQDIGHHRAGIHQRKIEKQLEERYLRFLKKDSLMKAGVMPHPIPYPEKNRGIHFNSHLPIHKRCERKKNLHPFAFEDRVGYEPRTMALATADTFKAMSAMAGASLCAIDRALKETILLIARVFDAVNAALEVDERRKRDRVKCGHLAVGKEYGAAADLRRGREVVEKIYHRPGEYTKRSMPIRQLN